MVPVIQIFAFYVITHGHYSPGGGFQGGVMLAASIILLRISIGEESYRALSPGGRDRAGGRGALAFALLGFAPSSSEETFLEYAMAVPGNRCR
jgi:multicomponent Na+:H+ antiporter subunit B